MRLILYCIIVLILLVQVLAGCGGLQQQVAPAPEAGRKTVVMRALNFSFEPNNIGINKGETLNFMIENVSDINHNFTLTNPDGGIMQDVSLPPGSTNQVRVEFRDTGIYKFYCNKPFHNVMGMQGQVVTAE